MADLPHSPDSNGHTGEGAREGPDRGSTTTSARYPGTPRWVKVFGIIALVVVLLVVIVMFTGVGGGHGPGRHMPSGGAGGPTPPSAHGVQRL
jgi:hypothetical protein